MRGITMTDHQLTVLVVGATGSIGRHVVAASVAAGHRTRALVRDSSRARGLDPAAEVTIGDLTDATSCRLSTTEWCGSRS